MKLKKFRRSRASGDGKKMDIGLLVIALGLAGFGLITVYNASVFSAFRDFADKYYFLKYQAAWAVLGVLVLFVVSWIDYHFWEKLALPGIVVAVILLLAVFSSFGIKVYGAQRWIDLGFFTLQPAEITKLAYILYLAAWFSKKIQTLPFLFVTGLILGIVLLQRDLGTATIIGLTGMSIFFVAGAGWWQVAGISLLGFIFGASMILSSGYRRARFLSFLNNNQDQLGTSYHINQVLIAIGSGGFLGVGLGQSRQKYGYIPEVTTDSIFAVVGNELGFIGAAGLIVAFGFLIYKGLKVAQGAPDRFGFLLALGITSWLGFQIIINIGAMVALLPLTGVPLPFISYGGTALVMVLASVGILLNISKHRVANKTGHI